MSDYLIPNLMLGGFLVLLIGSWVRVPRRCPHCNNVMWSAAVECRGCELVLSHNDAGALASPRQWSISVPKRAFIGELLFGLFYMLSAVVFLVATLDPDTYWLGGDQPPGYLFIPFFVAGVVMTAFALWSALGWETISAEPGFLVFRERLFGWTLRTRKLEVGGDLRIETGDSGFWTGFFSLRRETSVPSVIASDGNTRVEFAQGLNEDEQEKLASRLWELLGLPEPEERDDDQAFDDSIGGRIAEKLMGL